MTKSSWSSGSRTVPYRYRTAEFSTSTEPKSWGKLNSGNTPYRDIRRLAFHHPNRVNREWWKKRYKRWDLGGPFSLRKWDISQLSHADLSVSLRSGASGYSGMTFMPTGASQMAASLEQMCGTLPDPDLLGLGSMEERLRAYGSRAIASNIPYESVAQMGVALVEVLPINRLSRMDFEVPEVPLKKVSELMLSAPRKGKWKDYVSASGGEFLNIVFGWSPTIGDVEDVLYAVKESKRLLDEFAQRSRSTYPFREVLFEDERAFSGLSSETRYPTPGLPASEFFTGATGNQLVMSGTVREKIWSSGEFLIHDYTHGTLWDDMADWVARADYLLGLRPDAEGAWELTPFSWLVDWQTNVGQVLKNMSYIGRDGLALHYAYAMHSYDIHADVSNPALVRGHEERGPIRAHVHGNVRKRIRATPYGFGITPESLSEKQWSILGALGLTFVR